jgi:hypothetical protein
VSYCSSFAFLRWATKMSIFNFLSLEERLTL